MIFLLFVLSVFAISLVALWVSRGRAVLLQRTIVGGLYSLLLILSWVLYYLFGKPFEAEFELLMILMCLAGFSIPIFSRTVSQNAVPEIPSKASVSSVPTGEKRLVSFNIFGFSLLIYSISLILPAIYETELSGPHLGVIVLVAGWLSSMPEWFANVFLLVSWFLLGSSRSTMSNSSAIIAIILSLCCSVIAVSLSLLPVYKGMETYAFDFGVGYYVWVVGIIITFISSMVALVER